MAVWGTEKALSASVAGSGRELRHGEQLVPHRTESRRPHAARPLTSTREMVGFAADHPGARTWARDGHSLRARGSGGGACATQKDMAEQAYGRSNVTEKRSEMMNAWVAQVTAEPGKVVRIE